MKKRSKPEAAVLPSPEVQKTPGIWERASFALDRHAAWVAIALVLIATFRIIATYSAFSYTYDEPAHIATGMEWLEKHKYTYEPQHPPLTRAMVALLPYLDGVRGAGKDNMTGEGMAIFTQGGRLDRTLALSRAGILPFFWITCWGAFIFARWITGSPGASAMSVFLISMTPAVLAHSGLGTTDMGLTAFLMLAFYTGWRWIEEPTMARAVWFGLALGASIMAKFSTFAFFPVTAIVALLGYWYFERPDFRSVASNLGRRMAQLAVAAAIVLMMIWAGYWFSFGEAPYVSFHVPAPELLRGIKEVETHNTGGHVTYLMGESNATGWAAFYVIALAVKTPLPILLLALLGIGILCSPKNYGIRGWIIPSLVFGILIFSSLFSNIQIGTRHVMPVYIAFGIAGGCASLWLVRKYRRKTWPAYAIGLAMLLSAGSSFAAHPNYLGYFNLLAGSKPENVLVDSDLDWGQDMKLLGRRLRELGAKEVYFNQMGPGNMTALYGFPPIKPLNVQAPSPGWNAVSLTPLKLGIFGDTKYMYRPGFQFWSDQMEPTERVGTGILLFYIPPAQ